MSQKRSRCQKAKDHFCPFCHQTLAFHGTCSAFGDPQKSSSQLAGSGHQLLHQIPTFLQMWPPVKGLKSPKSTDTPIWDIFATIFMREHKTRVVRWWWIPPLSQQDLSRIYSKLDRILSESHPWTIGLLCQTCMKYCTDLLNRKNKEAWIRRCDVQGANLPYWEIPCMDEGREKFPLEIRPQWERASEGGMSHPQEEERRGNQLFARKCRHWCSVRFRDFLKRPV